MREEDRLGFGGSPRLRQNASHLGQRCGILGELVAPLDFGNRFLGTAETSERTSTDDVGGRQVGVQRQRFRRFSSAC